MGTPLGNGTNPRSQVLAGWEVYGTDVQNHPLGLPETCCCLQFVVRESTCSKNKEIEIDRHKRGHEFESE